MWTPRQLLTDETVEALRVAGFGPLQIEYLGWLSGTASALNRSRNAAKAAHTILASEKAPKMVAAFMARKQDSVRPKNIPDHDQVDGMFGKLRRWADSKEQDAEQERPRKDQQENEEDE
jgi:hypothetical protein